MARSRSAAVPKSVSDAVEDQGFEEVGGDVEKWEENKSIQGIYLKLVPARDKNSSPVACIKVEGEGIRRIYAPTVLESRLESVEIGKEVMILCLGRTLTIKNRKEKAWDFKVWAREAE